jgi:hypothetical protein
MKSHSATSQLSGKVQAYSRREAAFDELSYPLLILDKHSVIIDANHAALALPDEALEAAVSRHGSSMKIGELLNCINASLGCGRSAACSTCRIRESIEKASSGETVRTAATLQVIEDDHESTVHFRVTTHPLESAAQRLVIIMLENQALWQVAGPTQESSPVAGRVYPAIFPTS